MINLFLEIFNLVQGMFLLYGIIVLKFYIDPKNDW